MSLDAQYDWRSMKRRPLPRASNRRWQKGLVALALLLALLVYTLLFALLANFELPGDGQRIVEQVRIRLVPERLQVPEQPGKVEAPPEVAEQIDVLAESEALAEEKLDWDDPQFETFDSERMVELSPEVSAPENFLSVADAAFVPPETYEIDVEAAEELARQSLEALNTTVAAEDQLRIDPGDTDETDYLQRLTEGEGGEANTAALANYNTIGDLVGGRGGAIDPSKPILLPTDLLFDFGSAELRQGARTSLIVLGVIIDRSPEATFRIEGHTDTIGSDESNHELSRARAQAVADWLEEKLLIDSGQIEVVGFGESQPLVDGNGNEQQQALNRRVEIVVDGELGEAPDAEATGELPEAPPPPAAAASAPTPSSASTPTEVPPVAAEVEEPVEPEPVEAEPIEAEPVEPTPVEARPIEAMPVEPEPVEAEALPE